MGQILLRLSNSKCHEMAVKEPFKSKFKDKAVVDIHRRVDYAYNPNIWQKVMKTQITLSTKSRTPIHRDDPLHYVSNIEIDILHGEEQEIIGIARVFEVRMDQIVNDGEWSLFDAFDSHSSDLSGLYEELFDDDELNPAVADELMDYGNVVLIKSIVLMPEYRGQGLGGLLALAIAELFNASDIVALKPWPMNDNDRDCSAGGWLPPALPKAQQKTVASKLRKGYMKAGFKPLFRGSDHLLLTHFRHPTATDLIERRPYRIKF